MMASVSPGRIRGLLGLTDTDMPPAGVLVGTTDEVKEAIWVGIDVWLGVKVIEGLPVMVG